MQTVPAFPKRIEIELVSSCNLQCSYCPRQYTDGLSGFMDENLFRKVIDEIAFFPNTILALHRRGESFLHSRFSQILGYVSGKFSEVQIATNATLLTSDLFKPLVDALTFISFSIDTPACYNKSRAPARYEDAEANIIRFLDFNKGRVKTQVSLVRTQDRTNEEIDAFTRIWRGKVDRVRIYEEHSLGGVFGKIRSPRLPRMTCVMPWYELLIYCNGNIGRCNHDWNGPSLGNVCTQTIQDVWHSQGYEQLRRQQFSLEITDEVCKDCDSWYPTEGKQGIGEVVE